MILLTRRAFFNLAPALFLAPKLLARSDSVPVRLAVVYSPAYAAAARASEMSAAEVTRAATLLKREFSFTALRDEDYEPDGDWTGIINATSQSIATGNLPVVDITGAMPCSPHVYQLQPPEAQCPAGARCVVWHESLDRFGAEQLNDRFAAAGITPVDEQSWLAWFAVKCLWEAGARNKTPRDLAFDGHKGMPLRFNRAGVLLQPVYVMAPDGSVKEEIRPDSGLEVMTCAS